MKELFVIALLIGFGAYAFWAISRKQKKSTGTTITGRNGGGDKKVEKNQ